MHVRDEQWNAIIHCDSSYDGQFFYAVKTTEIFCRPSCKSRNPKKDNVLIFMTVDKHWKQGFAPASAVAQTSSVCQ